jgi:hypothetical protein
MLLLTAEFKRVIGYRITDHGQALHQAGVDGSSARSQRTPQEQAVEFRVPTISLVQGELVREQSLRQATRVPPNSTAWCEKCPPEDPPAQQDAARTVKIALLKSAEAN